MKKIKSMLAILSISLITPVLATEIPNEKKIIEEVKEQDNTFDILYKNVNYGELESVILSTLNDDPTIKNLEYSKEIIPIYDMNGERYAFFVPLTEEGEYKGYLIVGAVDFYYEVLTISPNEPRLTKFIIEESSEKDIIYNFPFTFLIKDNNKLYEIQEDCSLKNVEFNLNRYTREAEKASREYLELEEKMYEEKVYNPLAVTELLKNDAIQSKKSNSDSSMYELRSVDYRTFLDIDGYYGGNQQWLADSNYTTQFMADRSCGVTAAANLTAYLAENYSSKAELYKPTSLSKKNFTSHMNDVYEYIDPAIWGVPTIGQMETRVEKFAKSRNVTLDAVIDNSSFTYNNVTKYVKNGLNSDCPVLMITWDSKVSDLDWHWVTLTRFYTSGGSDFVTASNWGQEKSYNFKKWFDSSILYKGVLYFE